ncbi:group II truncated hemoglobin [Streptomyces chlorus]|uniref:Group II truncated hemoglobin n=1 Tax=Streptomyces chlorus TaxID=887452 RepID=A0ABW1DQN3_9ACTN
MAGTTLEVTVTMYDHVGGEDALRRLAEAFHRAAVADPQIGRMFRYTGDAHVRHLTAYLVEVFGHGSAFTDEIGGFEHVKKMHADLRITDEQRERFVELMLAAADEVELPDDERFRTRFEEQLRRAAAITTRASRMSQEDLGTRHGTLGRWTW